jgi:TonB family protein
MIAIAVKATLVLAAACCAAGILRARSAALRHAVWTAALAALLLLPAAGLLTPSWKPVALLPDFAPPVVVAAVVDKAPAPARPIPWLPIVYGTGVLAAALHFLAGALRVWMIARNGAPAPIGAEFGIPVVASPDVPMPLAWGAFRPVVLLPAAALEWPAARLRAVLLHEWLHHRRRDLWTQAIGQIACCLYWFHPLAWLALSRQRREREGACDDAVLRHGVAPHDYATSLVDVVRAIGSARRESAGALAMADSSSLEFRVRAVLDRAIDRRPLTPRATFAVALAAAAILAPLATVNLRAQPAGATITGVVQDPSGGVVPNCRVTARNLDGGNVEVSKADAAGQYRFTGIPAGHYALEFSAPGFALGKATADLVTGGSAQVDARLAVGQVRESVTVSAPRVGPAPVPQIQHATGRIRVGGMVSAAKLLRQTRPVYPPELQQAGVEGTVMLRAIISKDGAVLSAQVINSVDPRFAKAALDAVSQWQYQPALLNGEPIEILTSIDVQFQLDQ